MNFNRIKAILWLHIIRLWRYKYSAINMALNTTLWIAIIILGALMFMSQEDLPIGIPLAFWGIAMWTILSSCVWLIGAWTNFYISMGFVEEHMLVNTSSSKVLVGRAITGLSISTLAIIFIYYVLSSITGFEKGLVKDPLLILLGLIIFVVMAISYGLVLSALSFRTGVPGPILDISNFIFFIAGGIATPVSMLPSPVKEISLLIPYAYPSELVRYGAMGFEPYLPLNIDLMISIALALVMAMIAYTLMNRVEAYVRMHGVKAVGRM